MIKNYRMYGGALATVLAVVVNTAFVTNATSWASAVSVSSDAVTMSDTSAGAPQQFDANLSSALESLQNTGQTNGASVQAFYDSYADAQSDYQTAVSGATTLYNQTFMSDPAGARTALISNLNAARDTFVSAVNSAKDRLLTELNGGATTSAGTSFNGNYSVAINQYVSTVNGVTTQMQEVSQ